MLIGSYFDARYDLDPGTSGAAAEAAFFWSVASNYIKGGGIYMMPMLDIEWIVISGTSYDPGHWGYTKTTFSQWVNAWCQALTNSAATAGITIKPVIYTSSSFASSWLDSTVTGWTPWIADHTCLDPQTHQPTAGTSPWSTWTFWQYCSTNSVSGVPPPCDQDVFNVTSFSLTNYVIAGIPPQITSQPASQFVLVGSNVTFTVGIWGTVPLSYQWRFNGSNISVATGSSFTTNNVQKASGGSYSVVVTNSYGSTNSINALLTVRAPPVITAQPTNATTGLGLSASFSVTVTGDNPLSYQWQRNGTSLAGATTSLLTITNAQATNAGTYAVVVTNLYGTATSSNALLAVLDPYISNQPQSQLVAAGAPASLSVGAVGTAPLRYVGSENGVALVDGGNLSGTGSATLTIGSMQASNVGTYSVTVSNGNGGWVVSSNAALYAAFAPVIVTQPASQQAVAGSTVLLSVSVVGSGPLSYQWQRAGTNLADGGKISGSGTASLTVSNVQASEMASYGVVVTNTNGAAVSSNALVSLWPLVGWGNDVYGQADVPPGLSNAVAAAGGIYHSLVLNADGTVVAWGAGMNNTGASPSYGQAIVPAGLSNVVAVAAGFYHSLALKADGTVVAWGAGTNNTGASPSYGQAIVPGGLSNVVGIAAGAYHNLAMKSDGTVVAWGAGVTNTGATPNWGQAMIPAGLSNVVAVAGGSYHSLALKNDGTVVAWGAGANNTGSTPNYGQAIVPAGLSNVVAVAGGGYHSLALKADGTVAAWGAGANNTGSNPNYGQAIVPAGLSGVVAIAAGRFDSLALLTDGTVLGWGDNTYNQTNLPVGLANAIEIAGSVYHHLVLEGDGSPYITVSPFSQTAAAGATVRLAALAAGAQPLSCQWQCNGTDLPGATNTSLSLTNVQGSSAGSYSVVVTNALGSAASATALLTVIGPTPPPHS